MTLLHLPPIFYKPTNIVAVAASGLAFAFGAHARLHLCRPGASEAPGYLQSTVRSWTRFGILAIFHPWTELGRLATEPDPVASVVRILGLDGDSAPSRVTHYLARAQYDAPSKSLLATFFRPDTLRRMLRHESDENLSRITPDKANLDVKVKDVIRSR